MKCLYFKARYIYPLKEHIEHLNNIYKSSKYSKAKRQLAIIKVSVIFSAIDYASTCPLSKFRTLQTDEEKIWGHDDFPLVVPKVDNPKKEIHIKTKNLELIKNVGKSRLGIDKTHVFELRVDKLINEVNSELISLGFRCLFFVAKHHLFYYECYPSKPLYKKKYNDPKERIKGNIKTDVAVDLTYNIYKKYHSNPKDFDSLFVPKNRIDERL